MNIGLLIVLVLLVVPLTVIVGLECFSFRKPFGNKMDHKILIDAIAALKDDLIPPPMMDNAIAFVDIILVDKSCQRVETGLGLEKKLTVQGLAECIEHLPNNFMHHSKNQWVNRHWVKKVKTNQLELLNGIELSKEET